MDRVRCISAIPGDVIQWSVGFTGASCSCGIFTFRFGGQSNRPASLDCVYLGKECLNVSPTNLLCRCLRTDTLKIGWIGAHHFLPLPLGNGELPHPKIFAYGHSVHWTLHIVPRRTLCTRFPVVIGSDHQIGSHMGSPCKNSDDHKPRFN